MNSTSLSTEDARSVSGISTRMPNDRVSWITAWPMSRMLTPPWASTPVMAAVRPGRSSPVMLIRTISRKAQLPWQRRRAFYNSQRAAGGCSDTCHETGMQFICFTVQTFSLRRAFRILRGTFLMSRAALCEPARIRQARQLLPADLPRAAPASNSAGVAGGQPHPAAGYAGIADPRLGHGHPVQERHAAAGRRARPEPDHANRRLGHRPAGSQ